MAAVGLPSFLGQQPPLLHPSVHMAPPRGTGAGWRPLVLPPIAVVSAASVLRIRHNQGRSRRAWRVAVCAAKKKRGMKNGKNVKGKTEEEETSISPDETHARFIASLRKKYASDIVVSMDKKTMDVETFSTGALTLDMALGGGMPVGRVVEISGKASCGKTTLALHCLASVLKTYKDKRVCFIDAEHALDWKYANKIGIEENRFEVVSPESAEEATEVAMDFADSGLYKVIVIDSVAALAPEEELEKGMCDATIALTARIMSKFMRKIKHVLARTQTTLILINQLRTNIGGYGLAETTTGGRAIEYYCTIRISVRAPRAGLIGPKDKPTGIHCFAKVDKNKIAAPGRTGEYDIVYGDGISWESSVMEAALDAGIMTMKGAWLEYEDIRKQGKEKFVQALVEEPDVCKRLEEHVRKGQEESGEQARQTEEKEVVEHI